MAIVRGPFHSLRASGSVGDSLCFVPRGNINIAMPKSLLKRKLRPSLNWNRDLFSLAGRLALDLRDKGLIFNIPSLRSYDNLVVGWLQNYSTYSLRAVLSGGKRTIVDVLEQPPFQIITTRGVITNYRALSATTFHTFMIRILIGARSLRFKISRGRYLGLNVLERARYETLGETLAFNNSLLGNSKLGITTTPGFLLAWIYWNWSLTATFGRTQSVYPSNSTPIRDPNGRLMFEPIGQLNERNKWRIRYIDRKYSRFV